MEKAAVHSLASDSFVPKTRQKTALGFTPSETKEARCWTSAVWNFRRYGGEFSIGIVNVAAGNRDSRPPSPQGSTGFAVWQVPHPTSRL